MAEVKKLFLSSVARGFDDYRNAVFEAVSGLDDYQCVRMEDFGARDELSVEVCRDAVKSCDLYLGVFGPYYGSEVQDSSVSFTELEYNTASEAGLSRFVYLTAPDFPVRADLIELDHVREKQARLRQRVLEDRQAGMFDDPSGLGTKVVQSLYNYERKRIAQYSSFPDSYVDLAASLEARRDSSAEYEPSEDDANLTTALLFPFVTNQTGFDTGITVANASAGPIGRQPKAGNFIIRYFGESAGGDPPDPEVGPVVRPGNYAIWTLSSGGFVHSGGMINSAPGFRGYVVVECNFPNARGFAFISDPRAEKLAGSYVAEVISDDY